MTFQPTARALDEAATAATLGAGVPFVDVPPDRRSQHALVARLGGEFQSLDELVVAGWAAGPSETVVRLALTRVESADGEPVPLDVFVILPLTSDLLQSARVRLTFTVQHRSHRGELAPTAASLPDCLVSLAAGVAER